VNSELSGLWENLRTAVGPWVGARPKLCRLLFYTENEYFGISNCIFNFKFLALVVSEILGGSQIYTRGAYAPLTPQRKNFCTLSEYFTISNCVFNFSFISLVLYEILGWSQIYITGRCAPWMTPSGKIFIPKTSTLAYLIAFLISTF